MCNYRDREIEREILKYCHLQPRAEGDRISKFLSISMSLYFCLAQTQTKAGGRGPLGRTEGPLRILGRELGVDLGGDLGGDIVGNCGGHLGGDLGENLVGDLGGDLGRVLVGVLEGILVGILGGTWRGTCDAHGRHFYSILVTFKDK